MEKRKPSAEKGICKMSEATRIIGDFWTIMIIRELTTGKKRFGELEEQITDITSATLSSRLKELVEKKILTRHQFKSIPPKVEYSLTPKGKALRKIIKDIEKFGIKWIE